MKKLILILSTLFLLTSCGDVPTTATKFKEIKPLQEMYTAKNGHELSYYFLLLGYKEKLPLRYDTSKFKLFSLKKKTETTSITVYGLILNSNNKYYPALWSTIKLGDLHGLYSLNYEAETISKYPILSENILDLKNEKNLMLEYLESYAKEHNIKLN